MTTDWGKIAKLTAYLGENYSVRCERCDAVLGYMRVHLPDYEGEGPPVYWPEPRDGYTCVDGQWKPGRHLLDRLKRTGGLQRRHKRPGKYGGSHQASPRYKEYRPIMESDRLGPSGPPAYFRCWNADCNGLNVVGDQFWRG